MTSDRQNHISYGEQLATELPPIRRFITGHDSKTTKAIVQRHDEGKWAHYNEGRLEFNVLYTTSKSPVSLHADSDLQTHDELLSSGTLGLVQKHGSVLRIVDFAPNTAGRMHRTRSLDYGIVLEGEVIMVLDSGEEKVLRRGDVAIQRATFHQWDNRTGHWARLAFILLDCQPVIIEGVELGEDLGPRTNNDIPPSNNV